MEYIPKETAKFCGDISGLKILDVGCGDMIADIGLLSLGPNHITGLDVLTPSHDVKEHAAAAVTKAGHRVSADYASRLTHVVYNGKKFPFPDNRFDLVYSWGVFEHASDVPAVLSEMRRVVKPEGRIFIVVYPWFHCYDGSHLSDFIDEPFFHLSRPDDWVQARLKEYVVTHPDRANDLEQLWPAFCTLNRYSARMFLDAAMTAGLLLERLECHIDEKHVNVAPPYVDIVDVVSAGTTAVFRPAKSFTEQAHDAMNLHDELTNMRASLAEATAQRNKALQELEDVRRTSEQDLIALRRELEAERTVERGIVESVSWRVTKPARDLMAFLRKAPRT
jgi:ubiquinone/menaquinone biosynthesis C-methylase UbiE